MDFSKSCSPHSLPYGVYAYKCTPIVTIAHKAAPFCTIYFPLYIERHILLWIALNCCFFLIYFYSLFLIYLLCVNIEVLLYSGFHWGQWNNNLKHVSCSVNMTTLNLESEQGQDVDSPETQFSTCFDPIVFGQQTLQLTGLSLTASFWFNTGQIVDNVSRAGIQNRDHQTNFLLSSLCWKAGPLWSTGLII